MSGRHRAPGAAGPELLTRTAWAAREGRSLPAPPIRIVHLGLGAFHRAHQAWYTARVDDRAEWGIAAFTGRHGDVAERLRPQDGLYTLVERGDDGDRFTVIPSIAEAADGSDLKRLVELLADPGVAIVTLTVTEAGYHLNPDGRVDLDDPAVQADVASLRRAAGTAPAEPAAPRAAPAHSGAPETTLGRLLLGLNARRQAGAGPLAIVPCDNIPANGDLVREAVLELAASVDPVLGSWIGENVSFVSTSVDRITPRITNEDRELVARSTGWLDSAPVVTEPFTDWVLSGDFPAGRPAWERAGARFVSDIEPFERRKLWLLNGAHSLLAYAGILRGYATVAEAVADPQCRQWIEDLWDEDAVHLPGELLEIPTYRSALLERFGNARIAHRLEQVGTDGVAKLRVRIAPVVHAERAAGRSASGAIRVLGMWAAVVLSGARLPDTQSEALDAILAGPPEGRIRALLTLVDERLADDADVVSAVEGLVAEAAPPPR